MLKKITLVVAFSAFVLAIVSAAGFDWKAYSGTTIHVVFDSHPWQKFIQPLVPQFERETGIKVQVQAYPEDQFRQKLLVDLSAGSTGVDVFMFMPAQDLSLDMKNDWIQPVDTYLDNPSLTSPSFDYKDFLDGVRSSYEMDGKTWGVPLHVETFFLFYRKDLFAKYGLKVPETMQELQSVCKALKDDLAKSGQTGIYPIVMRGKTPDATSSMVNFLFSWGGTWFNPDGSCALDSEASQKALSFYADLLRNYGPPDATSDSWQADTQLFAQGQAAIMYDSNVFKAIVGNPQSSKVVGEVGYAALPAGPDGKRHPTVLTWGLGINSASQHKEAAWYFVQWALDKANQLGYLKAGGPAARATAWKDPQFLKSPGYSKTWVDVSNLQYSIAQGDWNPPVVNVQEGRNAYGLAIVAAIEGKDVGDALKSASKRMDEVVQSFGR